MIFQNASLTDGWTDKQSERQRGTSLLELTLTLNRNFRYKDYLKDEFTNYHIWIANYNQVEDPLRNQNWSLWQFSDNGSVRGIKGPVDLDLFNGNLADFKKYLLK